MFLFLHTMWSETSVHSELVTFHTNISLLQQMKYFMFLLNGYLPNYEWTYEVILYLFSCQIICCNCSCDTRLSCYHIFTVWLSWPKEFTITVLLQYIQNFLRMMLLLKWIVWAFQKTSRCLQVSNFHLPSRCCSLSVTLLLLLSISWQVPISVKVHFNHLLSSKNGKKQKWYKRRCIVHPVVSHVCWQHDDITFWQYQYIMTPLLS